MKTYKKITIALYGSDLSIWHNKTRLWIGSYEDLPINLSSCHLVELEKEGTVDIELNKGMPNVRKLQLKKWTKRRIRNSRLIARVEYKMLTTSCPEKRAILFSKYERLLDNEARIENFFANQ